MITCKVCGDQVPDYSWHKHVCPGPGTSRYQLCLIHTPNYDPNCERCREAAAINGYANKAKQATQTSEPEQSKSWPQATPTKSENDPSNYGGTSQLQEELEAIRVLHSRLVITYSNLLEDYRQSIGVKNMITANASSIFASCAKLETQVSDLLIAVKYANKQLDRSPDSKESHTIMSTNKP